MSLSRLYMRVIERGGVPSLSWCVCVRGVIYNQYRRESFECPACPETPGSVASNLSVALRPNEQDLERFEIATSPILCSEMT